MSHWPIRPVAEADLEPLANLWAERWVDAHAACTTPPELTALCTRADFLRRLQGSGAARALMDDGLARIADAGHREALLDCNPGNTRAAPSTAGPTGARAGSNALNWTAASASIRSTCWSSPEPCHEPRHALAGPPGGSLSLARRCRRKAAHTVKLPDRVCGTKRPFEPGFPR